MRILNRLLGVLVLLLLLAMALVTLGLVLGVLTTTEIRHVWPYTPVLLIARDVGHLPMRTQPWVVGGAIVVGLLALVLLFRELTPPPRRARTLVLRGDAPGYTEVTYRMLDELAARSAQEVQGIERTRARVTLRRGALTVRCQALVSPFVDLATAGPAVERTVAERLHHVTGLPVQTVRLRTSVQDDVRARRHVR